MIEIVKRQIWSKVDIWITTERLKIKCRVIWFIPFQVEQQAEDNEPVAESGRLFLRNLSYTCTEDEIRGLFEKYGPIAEVHLPIDKTTKRMTGIGFVTFVMPEHAVKAFNEVDGKVFQGRLLHILPARNKKTNDDEEYSVTGIILSLISWEFGIMVGNV